MMFPSFAAAGQQDGLFEDPNSLEKVFVTEKTEDGGEIVRHKDPSATVPENSRAGKIGAAIPSSYDLRTHGLVTPVKNQGDYKRRILLIIPFMAEILRRSADLRAETASSM